VDKLPSNSYISESELEEYVRNAPDLTPSKIDLECAAGWIEPFLDVPEEVRIAAAELAIELIEEG